MIVIVSKYLIPKGYRGLTLFPFVILRYRIDRDDKVLLNHERIHLRQQVELLVIPFFIWYGIEFLMRLVRTPGQTSSYHSISFEKEAYKKEHNLNYLSQRQLFAFLHYL